MNLNWIIAKNVIVEKHLKVNKNMRGLVALEHKNNYSIHLQFVNSRKLNNFHTNFR